MPWNTSGLCVMRGLGKLQGLFGGVEAGVGHAVKAEPVSSEFKSPLAATIYEVLNSTQREWTPDTVRPGPST